MFSYCGYCYTFCSNLINSDLNQSSDQFWIVCFFLVCKFVIQSFSFLCYQCIQCFLIPPSCDTFERVSLRVINSNFNLHRWNLKRCEIVIIVLIKCESLSTWCSLDKMKQKKRADLRLIPNSHANSKVPLAQVPVAKGAGDRNHPAHKGPFN